MANKSMAGASHRRLWLILLLAGAALALVFLAAGVADIELAAGGPLPWGVWLAPPELVPPPARHPQPGVLDRFLPLLLQVLVVISIIHFLVSARARKQVLRSLLLLLPILALYLLVFWRPEVFDALRPMQGGMAPPAPAPVPAAEFVANPSSWLVSTVTVAVALLVAAGLLGLAGWLWRRARRPTPLQELAHEARRALDAIQAGADIRDTIMRCYLEMSREIQARRGLSRGAATTPSEFERHLVAAGLPQEPVGQLTHLFERVRYGAKLASVQEEDQAVTCLAAIVAACQER